MDGEHFTSKRLNVNRKQFEGNINESSDKEALFS